MTNKEKFYQLENDLMWALTSAARKEKVSYSYHRYVGDDGSLSTSFICMVSLTLRYDQWCDTVSMWV